MERKIQSLEKHVEFLYEELEQKEQEIDILKKSLDEANDLCRLKSASKSNDDEEIRDLTKIVDEQRTKISCLRKHRDEILDRHEKTIDDYETEFKAKEQDIKYLQEDSEHLRKKLEDRKEELNSKLSELEEIKSTAQKKDLKNTSNSLSDELNLANLAMEKKKMELENKLLHYKIRKHESTKVEHSKYISKMEDISSTMKEELSKLKSSLNKLIRKKDDQPQCKLGWKCNRIFCILDHTYLFRKINSSKMSSSPSEKNKSPGESIFECVLCHLKVSRKSQLEIHMKLKHLDVVNFDCQYCQFKCNKYEKLAEHMKKKHSFACQNCEFSFALKKDLAEHMKEHTEANILIERKGKKQKKKKVGKKINPNNKTTNPKHTKESDRISKQVEEDSELDERSLESGSSHTSQSSSTSQLSEDSSMEERTESEEGDCSQ